MISPLIPTQFSNPIASMQQHAESQGGIQNQNAHAKVQKEEQQIRETVVAKDEAVLYDQRHDAKEESKNKYSDMFAKKKKKEEGEKEEPQRVNFDVRL